MTEKRLETVRRSILKCVIIQTTVVSGVGCWLLLGLISVVPRVCLLVVLVTNESLFGVALIPAAVL